MKALIVIFTCIEILKTFSLLPSFSTYLFQGKDLIKKNVVMSGGFAAGFLLGMAM